MKLVFIVLLLIALVFGDENVYVGSSGSDGGDCGDNDTPCLSISGAVKYAIATFEEGDSVSIILTSGETFSGVNNTNIILPQNMTFTITTNDDDKSTIKGDGIKYGFSLTDGKDLSVNNIIFSDLTAGVSFNSNISTALDVDSCNFQNTMGNSGAINFQSGSTLTVSNCQFSNNSAISILGSNATSVSITDNQFMNNTQKAISFSDKTGVCQLVDVKDNTFQYSTGTQIVLDVMGDDSFDGEIESCTFDHIDVGNDNIVNVQSTSWVIDSCTFSNNLNCGNVIFYSNMNNQNVSDLAVSEISIDGTCQTGIHYNGMGTLQIDTPEMFNVTDNCVNIIGFSGLHITGDDDDNTLEFAGCDKQAIAYTCTTTCNDVEIEMTNVNFESVGPILFSVSQNSNATLTDLTFNKVTGHVFDLTNGGWGLYSITIDGNNANCPPGPDAGIMFLTGSGFYNESGFDINTLNIQNCCGNNGIIQSTNALLSIDSSVIQYNNVTGNGGGINLSGFTNNSFSIQDTVISNNVATGTGGAIYIEAGEANTVAYFTDCTFKDNTAATGAAIGCCATSTSCYNVTLVVDDASDISGNVNTDPNGQDITCAQAEGDFTDVYSQSEGVSIPSVTTTSDSKWLMWTLISVAIVLVLGLIVAGIVGFVIYRKRSNYESLDD